MRHLVVLNPAAERGRAEGTLDRVAAAFKAHQLTFEIVTTQRAGHARQLVEQRGAEFDAIVAVGGDGTLHEIVQALDLEKHVLGLVPRGTGNDFAWMNGIARDIDTAVARIAQSRVSNVDLGTWGATRFHNSIGIGFEGQVNYESHRIRRLKGGALYLAAVVRTLSKRQTFASRFTWRNSLETQTPDGAWEGDLFMASVCVGGRVGGAFHLAPEARNDDGLLDVCIVGNVGLGRILQLLPRTFRGTHTQSSEVFMAQADHIGISIPAGAPVHVDGEFVDLNVENLELRLHPGVLRVL